jgi:hypothetical protein
MDVFIYFPPNLDVEKDVIEDALDEAIGDLGEVSGGGLGQQGMSIDLDVEDDADPQELADLLRCALASLKVPWTRMDINGKSVSP